MREIKEGLPQALSREVRQLPCIARHGYRFVSDLSLIRDETGIDTVALYLVDDHAPNAFAFGFAPGRCAVAVTTGLLELMSPRELRAVLAHEVAHITNRDTQVMTMAVGTVGVLAVLADVMSRWGIFLGGSRRSSSSNDSTGAALALVAVLVTVLAALASRLLMLAISRKRELLADATAVDLLRDPDALRRALEKLEGSPTVVRQRSRAIAHMWIESPLERSLAPGLPRVTREAAGEG